MKIFLLGATGYVGGTLANRLLQEGHEVRGLVRDAERGDRLRAQGVDPVMGDLESSVLLAAEARAADAVVHAAHADHRPSVEALLAALEGSGKTFIHTSGAGIVADMAGGEERPAVYDEATPVAPLPARAPRVALIRDIQGFAARGVRTVVVAPPMIYGRGTGLNAESIQIPRMIAAAREAGAGLYVGAGTNRWSHVHVEDLAELYQRALTRGPAGALYYADTGVEEAMGDIARSVSRMLGLGGAARSLSVAEAYEVYGQPMVDLSFGSNCRVRAVAARRDLGWSPTRAPLLEEIERGSYAV